MTNKNHILEQAGKLFASGQLLSCYECLLNAGTGVFITKGIEKNYFSSELFWNDFLADSNNFHCVFTAPTADELIFFYFNEPSVQSDQFEQRLAKEYPELFVNAVRLTQAFLNNSHLKHLLAVELPTTFTKHQKMWEWLYGYDKRLWSTFENEFAKQRTETPSNHLVNSLIWLEVQYFKDNSDQQLQRLSIIYNLFITLLLTEYNTQDFNLSEDTFYYNFEHAALRREKNPLEALMNKLSEWVDFNEMLLVPYCYDLNIEPVWKNDHFEQFHYISKEVIEHWRENESRYHNNRYRYRLSIEGAANKIFADQIAMLSQKDEHLEINYDVLLKVCASNLFLDDLHIENFILRSNKRVKATEMLMPLLAYSTNRLHRYIYAMERVSNHAANWKEALSRLMKKCAIKQIDFEPYFLMSKKDYAEFNRDAIKNISEDVVRDIIGLFGCTISRKNKFDRHNIRYDVWNQPFICIGEMLFSPMMFFAKNDWFYSFAQMGLRNLENNAGERKRTASLMEQSLGNAFRQLGWRVKVMTDAESSRIDGDIDIFITDDKDAQLLIQLKRTYFRTTLKTTFNETIKSDRKAAKQLNDAVHYLQDHPDLYALKEKHVRWVVSTSFENIGEDLNGCLKVNYFELIFLLRNFPFSSIEELQSYLNEM